MHARRIHHVISLSCVRSTVMWPGAMTLFLAFVRFLWPGTVGTVFMQAATQFRFYFYHVLALYLSCPRNLSDLMSGMIIVIWVPDLISNFRNLSISIEGPKFLSRLFMSCRQPTREVLGCPVCLQVLTHFWCEGGYMRWLLVIRKRKWTYHCTAYYFANCLFIHILELSGADTKMLEATTTTTHQPPNF